MRLEYFEYLLEIAKYNNMRIASEYLHMTPQALSSCIKNMEEEIGFTILERKPKGVTFTNDGQKLLACAERILADYRQTLQAIYQETRQAEQHDLLIYTTPIINMCLGSSLVEKIHKDYVYVTVNMISDIPENWQTLLDDEQRDVLVILTTYNGQPDVRTQYAETFTMQHCFSDELVVAVSKNHALARQNTISLAELKNQTMIHCTGKAVTMTSSHEILLPIQDEVKHTYCNSITLWGKMIAGGLGVGLIIERGLKQAFREGDIDKNKVGYLRFDLQPKLDCICLYRKDAPLYVQQIASAIAEL